MKMEKELNYLSQKIEELSIERDFQDRLLKGSDYDPIVKQSTRLARSLNTEIKLLKSILTVVTNID